MEAYVIIRGLFTAMFFTPLGIVLAYTFDKEEKTWNRKVKLLKLGFVGKIFLFADRKQGKMSLLPFVLELFYYLYSLIIIPLYVLGILNKIGAFVVTSVVLFCSQFFILFVFICYYGIKFDEQRRQEKKNKEQQKNNKK